MWLFNKRIKERADFPKWKDVPFDFRVKWFPDARPSGEKTLLVGLMALVFERLVKRVAERVAHWWSS